MKRALPRKICLLCAFGVLLAWLAFGARDTKLEAIHSEIQANFETVNHIGANDFAALDAQNTIVFDVRMPQEFEVSHLKGAVQIDPAISSKEFAKRYKNLAKGKTVVFYCSVGWRSSELAARVDSVLEDQGVAESYNLVGGLFQWHNENRPLTSTHRDEINAIHPYNSHWGQLIEDQSAIQYKPDQI